jgi:UDP-4-amino-4,6-dideoxy-N-acetyl-beta-L-altrosamine N-acetyltransferase
MYALELMSEKDLALVHEWRNSERVRRYMIHRDYISIDNHTKWFNNLNVDNNKYYIYSVDKERVGMVNLKNIDYKSRTAEAGMYCGNHSYVGHMINVLAPIRLYSYAFNTLLLETIYAQILAGNEVARKLNRKIGFEELRVQEDIVTIALDKNRFFGIDRMLLERSNSVDIKQ